MRLLTNWLVAISRAPLVFLENLPIPKALRTEFLNKAAQLAPDVDAVRDYVRRSYSSLSDMADKPS